VRGVSAEATPGHSEGVGFCGLCSRWWWDGERTRMDDYCNVSMVQAQRERGAKGVRRGCGRLRSVAQAGAERKGTSRER
jgi:hypothetical protein